MRGPVGNLLNPPRETTKAYTVISAAAESPIRPPSALLVVVLQGVGHGFKKFKKFTQRSADTVVVSVKLSLREDGDEESHHHDDLRRHHNLLGSLGRGS